MKYNSIIVENNYQDIMRYLEVKGYIWSTGDLPTEWQSPSSTKVINIGEDKTLSFSRTIPDCRTMTLDEFKSRYPITLGDLKPGIVIEYADNRRRMIGIFNNKLTFYDSCSYLEVEDKYTTTLEYRTDSRLNINKVFIIREPASLYTMINSAICIWERPQILEVTMDEIAKKFGIPVNQLKIKE